MSPWQWLQANNAAVGAGVVIFCLLLIALVFLLFWRGERRERAKDAQDPTPPLDRALMDMSDDEMKQGGIK